MHVVDRSSFIITQYHIINSHTLISMSQNTSTAHSHQIKPNTSNKTKKTHRAKKKGRRRGLNTGFFERQSAVMHTDSFVSASIARSVNFRILMFWLWIMVVFAAIMPSMFCQPPSNEWNAINSPICHHLSCLNAVMTLFHMVFSFPSSYSHYIWYVIMMKFTSWLSSVRNIPPITYSLRYIWHGHIDNITWMITFIQQFTFVILANFVELVLVAFFK